MKTFSEEIQEVSFYCAIVEIKLWELQDNRVQGGSLSYIDRHNKRK